jgi:hypothetical protein
VSAGRALLLGLALLAPGVARADAHLLVVVGLGGEPKTGDALHESALKLVAAAEQRLGLRAADVVYLGEKPERDPTRIAASSRREEVEKALGRIAERARPGDLVMIVLLGYGSYQPGDSRFMLPGPDMRAEDFASLLARFQTQKVVLVNTTSASGEFVKALKGPGRVIVTATKSGMEKNETVFWKYFVEALTGDGADTDKDGRVSVAEAFEYARREVARSYEESHRLLTEHAVMEDGSGGTLAKTLFLQGTGSAVAEATPSDPRLAALLKERRALEDEVETLKAKKASMEADAYQRELERLLLAVAEKTESIRAASKGSR